MKPDKSERVISTLELLLREDHAGLTMTAIAKELELPLSSAHGLLRAMVESRLLTSGADRRYRIGPRTVQLGIHVMASIETPSIARPYLEDLARQIGYDVYLAVPLHERVVYVDRCPGSALVTVNIRLGEPLYLHATATGKLFAALVPAFREQLEIRGLPRLTSATITDQERLEAELDRIVRDDVSISLEEGMDGVEGVAVPIRGPDRQLIAAVHVSALRGTLSGEHRGALIHATIQTAFRVEARLAGASV